VARLCEFNERGSRKLVYRKSLRSGGEKRKESEKIAREGAYAEKSKKVRVEGVKDCGG